MGWSNQRARRGAQDKRTDQGLIYCVPVKIATTALVTSSLSFQAARSGKIVKSSTVLPHCARNLVRAFSSPGKAR